MPDDEDRPVVLIVDDEPEIVDLYNRRLKGTYAVRTAYGGTEALEEADESVDIVLLDRRMPDLSGDD
ncbi:MAG: response regulator, partial [Halobacteriales archaeon]|nr:response regulator [Halobacteriales archaeon]